MDLVQMKTPDAGRAFVLVAKGKLALKRPKSLMENTFSCFTLEAGGPPVWTS